MIKIELKIEFEKIVWKNGTDKQKNIEKDEIRIKERANSE